MDGMPHLLYVTFLFFTSHCYAESGIAMASYLSVRLSVRRSVCDVDVLAIETTKTLRQQLDAIESCFVTSPPAQ